MTQKVENSHETHELFKYPRKFMLVLTYVF
jgi:hypothetical protein